MRLGGAENQLKQWVSNFANNVEDGYKKLNLNPEVRKHGIAQMTQAGGSGKRITKIPQSAPKVEKFVPEFIQRTKPKPEEQPQFGSPDYWEQYERLNNK